MVTLPELAASGGVSLDLQLVATGERGPEYQGPCPGCGGDDRFHVWPEQHSDRGGSFWCRQCEKAGDGIQFLRDFAGLSFRDACRLIGGDLENKLNIATGSGSAYRRHWKSTPISPPKRPNKGVNRSTEMKARECSEPPLEWQEQATKYVIQGQASLMANPAALTKLEKERGLTLATVERFNLGLLLPRPGARLPCRFSSRRSWGLPPKKGAKKPDLLWLPRGLIIPAPDNNLFPVNLKPENATENATASDQGNSFFRLRIRRPAQDIVNGGSKYFVVPGSGMAPLLLHDRQPAIVVVESELDAILIYQEVGTLCGVLALGNASARPDQKTADILEKIPLIILAFDNDQAGVDAAERWQTWYSYTERLSLPDGIKDPGELHQSGADLKKWIMAALPSPWRIEPYSLKINDKPQALDPAPAPAPNVVDQPPASSVNNPLNPEELPPESTPQKTEVAGWTYSPAPNNLEVMLF